MGGINKGAIVLIAALLLSGCDMGDMFSDGASNNIYTNPHVYDNPIYQ